MKDCPQNLTIAHKASLVNEMFIFRWSHYPPVYQPLKDGEGENGEYQYP